MIRKDEMRTRSRAFRPGDRVSVGALREALEGLPDEADLVVSVVDADGPGAPVESVDVTSFGPEDPRLDVARLEARVGFATGGDPLADALGRAEAAGSCLLGEIGALMLSKACPTGSRCRRCLPARGLAAPAARGRGRRA